MENTSDYASSGEESDLQSDDSIQFLDELSENDYNQFKQLDNLPHSTEELLADWQEEMKCNMCKENPSAIQAFVLMHPWIVKENMPVFNLAVENGAQADPNDAFMYCSTCDHLYHFKCCFENFQGEWDGFPEPPIDIPSDWKCCKCD